MRKYFLLILLGVLIFATVGWIARPQKTQEVRSRAAAASTLSFEPADLSTGLGQTVSIAVNVVPSTNIVTAAELHLQFDPALLELVSISPASVFSVLTASVIDNSAGQASITVGAPPLSPVQAPTSVATVAFRTKSSLGSAGVSLTADTKVAALNEERNAVSSLLPATIRIIAPTPTPTPIPTATPTPAKTTTPTPQPAIAGDLDRNGVVDIYDYNILVTNFGRTGTNVADIDGNGKVDIFDYNILVGNFGRRR
ncbi:hypothetical protein HY086_01005 [Candidatus Gottesmanbacteria bacterium]|nr:hypothetical protein [Candidatus Gottesmanbacteria bacterium]